MQKRIGVITIYDPRNIGNRLQNHAVHAVMEKLGCKCETIVPVNTAKKWLLMHTVRGYRFLMTNRSSRIEMERRYQFARFDRQIPMYLVCCKNNVLPSSLAAQYDAFVTGSDQVWNPLFWKDGVGSEAGLNNYFLRFAQAGQRLCFSPSIGMGQLPEEWKEPIRGALLDFQHIGIREQGGANIVEHLTGQKAEVTLDPTLMLDANEWQAMERPTTARPKGKYALYMFLGSAKEECPAEASVYLDDMQKRLDIKPCWMFAKAAPDRYVLGPDGFLNMIRNAELVVTDSYHCVVFSILFNKPFVLFPRKMKTFHFDMSSRTDTLLDMLGLGDRKTSTQVWDDEHLLKVDYTTCHLNLAEAREKTMDFLRLSLQDVR